MIARPRLANTRPSRFYCLALAAGLLVACAEAQDAADGGVGPGPGDGSAGGGGGGSTGGGTGFQPTGGTPVTGENRRPELKRIGDREAEVGVSMEIQLEATDPDGDPLTFNVKSSLPDGAKFEKGAGRFTWTPAPDQAGTLVLLTFEVADAELRDQETIQISVVAAGQAGTGAPKLDPIGDLALAVGRPFAQKIEASDPNGDELTFSMRGAEALTGATLDAAEGLFQWTPDANFAGQSWPVTFVVSDGTQEASEDVNLVVAQEGGGTQDMPPRIDPIDDREVEVGKTVDIVVRASDERPESLIYEIVVPNPLPGGASFDAAAAHLAWTPQEAQANQAFRFVFRVSDGTYRAIEQATLTVVAGEGPAAACTPDPGEPREDELTPLQDQTPVTGSVCPADDVDTFTFQAAAGDAYTLDVSFAHAEGDLDVTIFGPENYERASDSMDDDESVRDTVPVAGTYTAYIYGYDRVTNPQYTVSLHVETSGGGDDCAPPNDAAEGADGNDDEAHAAALRDNLGHPLRICAGDEDVFLVELEAGTRATVTTLFNSALGDLDTELSGPNGFHHASLSADDDEEHVLDPVPATGRYLLRVFGFQDAANTYTLALEKQAAVPCAPDRVEPNDARGNAEPLPPNAYNNLTWCGDDDWYKTETSGDESLQVYISYDAAVAPTVEAWSAAGAVIGDVDWESLEPATDGCRAARAQCRRLTVRPPAAGWVSYRIFAAEYGMAYDLSVRLQAGGAVPQCSAVNQTCAIWDICDYPNGRCESPYCEGAEGFPCPDDYICHENWCVELCNDDLTCSREGYACKMLGGWEMCGLEGVALLGEPCFDFTDCAGSMDCLNDPGVPDGYCSRACAADADCPGGRCAVYSGGNFCGKTCQTNDQCRDGYVCASRAGAGGGDVRVCEPSP